MRFKTGWILLACALLAAAPALAATRYVSPTGSDGGNPENDCTAQGTPCKTIQHAVIVAASTGDVIRVFPGTYNECVDASAKAIDFIADAIETANPPSRAVTIIDGTGVCGGRVCLNAPATSCLLASACAGTCEIAEGETEGTCSNLEAACAGDQDCGDPCVNIGHCSATTATVCAMSSQCPAEETCVVRENSAPTIWIGDGSSLKGFTVKGGGEAGVRTTGSTLVEKNVITGNASSQWGGGLNSDVSNASGPSKVADPMLCWSETSLSCTSEANCSVCEKDHAIECTDSEACAPTEAGDCVSLGPCLVFKQATIDDNEISGNVAADDAGGLNVNVIAGYGAGARAVITANTISGNTSIADGGGAYLYTYAYYGGKAESKMTGNTVSSNAADAYGGGIASWNQSWGGGVSRAAITTNTIEGNSAGVDGGGSWSGVGYFGESYYDADDKFDITGNTVSSNSAARDGGGIAVALWRSAYYDVLPKATVESNTVADNTSGHAGGGIDLYLQSVFAFDYPVAAENGILADKNTVTGNTAGELGGGISAVLQGYYSFSMDVMRVEQNTIRENSASTGGGGAYLETDSSYILGGKLQKAPQQFPFPNESSFSNNLLLGNVAHNEDATGVGGGAFVVLVAGTSGFATAGIDFATMQSNRADMGGGAVEVEADTGTEGGGIALLGVANSIAASNGGYAIGGPVPGQPGTLVPSSSGDLEIFAQYSDGYDNSFGEYERTLTDVIDAGDGLLQVDPMLNASGVPNICSPTIDAAAPPPEGDFSFEPMPNGFRANMGHLGNTAGAVATLPDVNLDRQVSGIDVIMISNSFGATQPTARIVLPDTRYLLNLDINQDGVIDGEDLAFVAAYYGTDCR